ncbi:MAG: hypothetical protein JO043_01640 [Candidatus Eremiobacteraeota bacterium]|nr:hypothetical protein [Candidatus Eremiobacteraeota bacterium]
MQNVHGKNVVVIDRIYEVLVWGLQQTGFTEMTLILTRANDQPAFTVYGRDGTDAAWEPHAIHVLTIEDGAISVIHNFMDRSLFTIFDERRPT